MAACRMILAYQHINCTNTPEPEQPFKQTKNLHISREEPGQKLAFETQLCHHGLWKQVEQAAVAEGEPRQREAAHRAEERPGPEKARFAGARPEAAAGGGSRGTARRILRSASGSATPLPPHHLHMRTFLAEARAYWLLVRRRWEAWSGGDASPRWPPLSFGAGSEASLGKCV
uniref:Expressed protein n=3 Tax=Oryza TaxID=4527 RepID=Q2QMS9_ORYSJ|nr:expressed protein [Oryza sativa Japonica Group]